MKKFVFDSEEAFLSAMDGKVFAISNGNGDYLCDVLEDDYVRMLNEGVVVNLDDESDFLSEYINVEGAFSQYILVKALDNFEAFLFKEMFGFEITIKTN